MPTDTPIACQLGVFSADERRRYQAVRSTVLDVWPTKVLVMDLQDIETLVRRWTEAIAPGRLDIFDQLLDKNVVDRSGAHSGPRLPSRSESK